MRAPTLLLTLVLLLGACSGGDDPAPAVAEGQEAPPAAEATPGGDLVADLPQFASDFDQLCTTQVGFPGATAYDASAPGPHPVMLFTESDGGLLVRSSSELGGWGVVEDSDFEDNSDLVPTELVACARVAAQKPTEISCDLEGDDGSTTTLRLVDQTFTLTVHEATTGATVGEATVEAVDTECPFFTFVDEGQTDYLNTPTEEQWIEALRPFVQTG